MVLGWARYTPEDFVFAAKVPQTVTHDRLLDLGKGADKDLLAYCELMRPLLDAGKLGPLLLQLPPRLRFQEATIHRFLDILPRDFTFALEPRNKTWMTMEAFDLLRATGVAYTIVDEPLLPPDLHVTSSHAYLRWHGHGQDPWYNYRYGEDELKSWVPRVQQVGSQAETVHGFFNNHFVYHDTQGTGKWTMYPWDQDKTWGYHDGIQGYDVFVKMPLTTGMAGDVPPGWPKNQPPPNADAPKDAFVEAVLQRFMDPNRLDRAKRIDSRDVDISRDGDTILARVKDYRVELDPGARTIIHDCEDWGKLVDRKDFCKHVGKFFLSLPKTEALSRLEAILSNRDAWTFSTTAR